MKVIILTCATGEGHNELFSATNDYIKFFNDYRSPAFAYKSPNEIEAQFFNCNRNI